MLDNQPVPRPEDILAAEQQLPRSFLLVLARRVFRRARWQWGLGIEDSEEWQITKQILAITKRETEARGARFLLLYVPTSNLVDIGQAEELLESWARKSETSFVNLRERFFELPESQRIQLYDGHWTSFGNRVAADIVANFISSNRLLSGASSSPPQ